MSSFNRNTQMEVNCEEAVLLGNQLNLIVYCADTKQMAIIEILCFFNYRLKEWLIICFMTCVWPSSWDKKIF